MGSLIGSYLGGAGSAGGLLGPVLSTPAPTQISTGLTSWWNQPASAVATDIATGTTVFCPNQAGNNICARRMAAPASPYTITALVAFTNDPTKNVALVFGFSDGTASTNKLEFFFFEPYTAGNSGLQVNRYTNATTFSATPYTAGTTNGAWANATTWLRLSDDGTTVKYMISADGVNFITLLSVTKSGSFLTATGYSQIVFGVHAIGGDGYATILSWKQA